MERVLQAQEDAKELMEILKQETELKMKKKRIRKKKKSTKQE